jgi:hypothetical protein
MQFGYFSLKNPASGSSIVTPIVGQLEAEFSVSSLRVNRHEVEEAFVASFRHLADPNVTGYTQFRVKGTPGGNSKARFC